MEPHKIGEFLKKLRQQAGYTQADLGSMIEVTDKAISRWESGNGFPEISNLLALSELYGITTDDILHCNENVLNGIKHKEPAVSSQAPIKDQNIGNKNKLTNVSQKFTAVIFFAFIALGIYITSWTGADTNTFIPSYIIYMVLAVCTAACGVVSQFIKPKIVALIRVCASGAFLVNTVVLVIMQFVFAYSDSLEAPFATLALLLVFAMYVLYALHDFFDKNFIKRIFAYTAAAVSIAVTVYCAVTAVNTFFNGDYSYINVNIARGLIGCGCTVIFFAAAQLFGNKLCFIAAVFAAATGVVCIVLGQPLQDSPFLQSGLLPTSLWIGLATFAPAMIMLAYAFENTESQHTIRRTLVLLAIIICMPLIVNSFDIITLNTALGTVFYSVQVLLRLFAIFAFIIGAIVYFDIKGAVNYFIKKERKNESD